MNAPILSFVTGARNRFDDFRRLVDSIEVTVPKSLTWELIVSDASDTPLENEPVATDETWPNIYVIPERPRLGWTIGYNTACRAARGEFCMWLNDDCILEEGCAEIAVKFMRDHPHVGLGCIPYREPPARPEYQVNSYFDLPYANFGIMPRDFGNEIGWFDTDFHMYAGDNSIAFRTLLAGKGISQIAGSHILHFATNDIHRRENDDQVQRRKDTELLAAKYGPSMDAMKSTYAQLGGSKNGCKDQTPQWLRKKVHR